MTLYRHLSPVTRRSRHCFILKTGIPVCELSFAHVSCGEGLAPFSTTVSWSSSLEIRLLMPYESWFKVYCRTCVAYINHIYFKSAFMSQRFEEPHAKVKDVKIWNLQNRFYKILRMASYDMKSEVSTAWTLVFAAMYPSSQHLEKLTAFWQGCAC